MHWFRTPRAEFFAYDIRWSRHLSAVKALTMAIKILGQLQYTSVWFQITCILAWCHKRAFFPCHDLSNIFHFLFLFPGLKSSGKDGEGGLLGLPESETELENLTEFNTAHNRRITMLGKKKNHISSIKRREIKRQLANLVMYNVPLVLQHGVGVRPENFP